MSEISGQELTVVKDLHRICSASERGFNLAGEHVQNQGLKLLFKSLAQERAEFAEELRALVPSERQPRQGSGALAALHRGWINIKAGMTIGELATESVVLDEVSRGERAARRAYRSALERQLPDRVEDVMRSQYERLEETKERIEQLRGVGGTQTVVQLFDSEEDAKAAQETLSEANYGDENVERVKMEEAVARYQGQETGRTSIESTVAGALLGAALGIVIGLVAMISARLAPGESLFGMSFGELAILTMFTAIVAGLLIGGLIGAILGVGVVQEDAYQYSQGIEEGSVLLMVHADEARAEESGTIMKEVYGRRLQEKTADGG